MESQEKAKPHSQWEKAVEACLAVVGELNASIEAVHAAAIPWLESGTPQAGPLAESFFRACERSGLAEQTYDKTRAMYDTALQLLIDARGRNSIAPESVRLPKPGSTAI